MTVNPNISVTTCIYGPFVIVVTDPQHPEDHDYPLIVCPPGGYQTKEDALAFIERFAKRKEPYLGLHFNVAQLGSEKSFIGFCSWED